MSVEKVVGKIIVKTGLHIGGSNGGFEIGGVDNPIIRVKRGINSESLPYIPGSSLKGKIRYLLTKQYDFDIQKKKLIDEMFGIGASAKNSSNSLKPSNLIFRDSFLCEEFVGKKTKIIEIKAENTIDRGSGKANPRFMERTIPEISFNAEIVIRFNTGDDIGGIKKLLFEGLELLENDYLGGSGTRGYGKVDLSELKLKLQ